MSRNFELMQLAGDDAEFHRVREVHETVSPVNSLKEGEYSQSYRPAHRDAIGLDLDGLAYDESLRLVQRTFLQGEGASRTVVFAGVDHGNGCSRLCVRIAETPATPACPPSR